MKILFMGTPDFAKTSLEKVFNAGYEIIGVVTNPDKAKGRGMKIISSPVKEFAVQNNIPVYQPLKIRKNEEFIKEIKRTKSRYNMCCSLWKNITKRAFRNSKIRMYKCSWITSSKVQRRCTDSMGCFKW